MSKLPLFLISLSLATVACSAPATLNPPLPRETQIPDDQELLERLTQLRAESKTGVGQFVISKDGVDYFIRYRNAIFFQEGQIYRLKRFIGQPPIAVMLPRPPLNIEYYKNEDPSVRYDVSVPFVAYNKNGCELGYIILGGKRK